MDLGGTWYNELGSQMTLEAANGALSGTYNSAVGSAEYEYALAGRYNTDPSSGGQALSWAVAWQNQYGNSNSATAWAGQYQVDAAGVEEIYTLWLLASEMPESDDWESTKVGQDTFTRTKPSDDDVAARRRMRPVAHPRRAARPI